MFTIVTPCSFSKARAYVISSSVSSRALSRSRCSEASNSGDELGFAISWTESAIARIRLSSSRETALDAIVQAYETKIGPHNGAQVVAKAWSDPLFKKAVLEDATKAVGTLGHVSRVGDHLVAVENTPARHNMVVCTLCSCYPWEMLGLPPVWYKAAPYRSRAVKDPRGVLADFGVTLPKETEIRVWDSTAETRFLVLPMRPPGTEGWSEAQLAELVTRDSMIGTGLPTTPGAPS